MYVDLIRDIERTKEERFSEPRITARGLSLEAPRKAAGLYFIYTSYSLDELAGAVAVNNGGAVPISRLVAAHRRMPGICQITRDGFRLVYNGIGGFNGSDYGLRKRIGQQFTTKDPRTGALCIRESTVSDLSRWRISYVTLHCQHSGAADFGPEWTFSEHALDIERCWRLQCGWPLLCRH